MKKRNLALLILLIITVCCTALFASCGDFPDYIFKDDGNNNGGAISGANKYEITVKSSGGLLLNDVYVTAKKNGETVKSGVSINGKVEFILPLDEYDLEFGNLPNGYFLKEGQTLKTSATDNKFVAEFTSQVLNTTAPYGTQYTLGDVMHDFTVSDIDDNNYTLSGLLEDYKAVVLNFWYDGCVPCLNEFPALNSAYQQYSEKLKVLAISNQDNKSQVEKYEKNNFGGLDISMCASDSSNVINYFSVSSFPTTIIIDRFGVVVFRESGSITDVNEWKNMFEKYVSDDYVQDVETETNPDGGEILEYATPEGTMPDTTLIESVVNGENFNFEFYIDDDEYSWPFQISSNNDYIYPSNIGVKYSFATICTTVELTAGQVLTFEYNIISEEGCDILYVIIDNSYGAQFSGNSNGWQTHELMVADRNVSCEIAFVYIKDQELNAEDEMVGLRNFKISALSEDGQARDYLRDCASGSQPTALKYTNYIDEFIIDDNGYYHKKNEDGTMGSFIYADIIGVTPWAKLRFSGNVCYDEVNNTEYYYALYYLSFWKLPDVPSADDFTFNGNDYTQDIYDLHPMQDLGFSDNGLLPVNARLKNLLQDFAIEWANRYNDGIVNENTWQEFCYYYDHYGEEHANGICNLTNNPIVGITPGTAFIATEGVDITNNDYRGMQQKRGVKYKFTATKSGVYQIYSKSENLAVDPYIYLVYYNGNSYYGQDDANDYDRFKEGKYGNNFNIYVYLEKDQVIYIAAGLRMPGDTGVYDFRIDYIGESANKLLHCTTDDGLWTYIEETGELVYLAVDVVYNPDDGIYYHVTENNELGSPIYINFVYGNFFDTNGKTLYEMIDMKKADGTKTFDFTNLIGINYTNKMKQFYQASIEGKTESDELYGMHLATKELIDILNMIVTIELEETADKEAWRQFACYYQYYGAPQTQI